MNLAAAAGDLVKRNPKVTSTIATGAAFIVAPVIVTGVVLPAVGFGAGGVVAGSAAASIHSAIGPTIAAKGAFATLTSAGAGGYGVAVVNGIVQAGGASVVGLAGIKSWFSGRKNSNEEEAEQADESSDAAD